MKGVNMMKTLITITLSMAFVTPAFAQQPKPATTKPRSTSNAEYVSSAIAGRPYKNCDEARAHNDAPVYSSNPRYGLHLDRDRDGVGCEPYKGEK